MRKRIKNRAELKRMDLKGVQVKFEDCSVKRDDKDGKIKLIASAAHDGKKKCCEFDEFKEKLTKNEFAKRNIANESAKWLNKWRNFKRNARKRILFEITKSEAKERFYSNISQEDFDLAVGLDPTARKNEMGKYSKWLLLKKNLDAIKGMSEQDLRRIREELKRYDELKKKNLLPLDKKDISKLNVNSFLSLMSGVGDLKSKTELIKRTKKEETERWKIGKWIIISPKTKQAARLYSMGAMWDHDDFDEYASNGKKLWLLINEKTKKRYLLRFENLEFKNDKGKNEPLSSFFAAFPELKQFFENQGYDDLIKLKIYAETKNKNIANTFETLPLSFQIEGVKRFVLEINDWTKKKIVAAQCADMMRKFSEEALSKALKKRLLLDILELIAIHANEELKDALVKTRNAALRTPDDLKTFIKELTMIDDREVPMAVEKTIQTIKETAGLREMLEETKEEIDAMINALKKNEVPKRPHLINFMALRD